MERPSVLVIAGYDPSGGAGVLADVKTLESQGVYGYAVCTAMTWQNERVIRRVDWTSEEDLFGQIDICFEARSFDWVKIGIAPSMGAVGRVVRYLRQRNPAVRVVWDPVVRASSGVGFLSERAGWEEAVAQCFVLTPNWDEMAWLYPEEDLMERCRDLTSRFGCHIFLKGGHHPEHPGRDYLWSRGVMEVLEPATTETVYPKHGSGCVLASALTANLALGHSLQEAAARSKAYIEQFLVSNKTLLGWHR